MSQRPLGFGIWGTGMIAEFHAKALAEIVGAKRVAAVEADPREAGGHLARPIDPAEDVPLFADALRLTRAIQTRDNAGEEQPGRTDGLRAIGCDEEDRKAGHKLRGSR